MPFENYYQITWKDGHKSQVIPHYFHLWLTGHKMTPGQNFETRLAQLRAYLETNEISDWSLEDK